MAERPVLGVINGTEMSAAVGEEDPYAFQARCIDGWVGSLVARGFSPLTIEGDQACVQRFLDAAGKFAWELSPADVDAVMSEFESRGAGPVTRRDYVSTFSQFFGYLEARHRVEIEHRFGMRLSTPIDRFHAGHHVGDPAALRRVPPTPQRMEDFFAFLRERMEVARKWTPWARDYALFRTMYHVGLRSGEVTTLEVRDLHFDRGPFGKIHVRLGKAAKGSGPRPRWVPMLDDIGSILRWYLAEVRPRFRKTQADLFCDEGGGSLATGTVRNRLRYLLRVEGRQKADAFRPHDLRHACATRNYERGVDLVAIQQLLGHWHIGTTMTYVTPSSTFIEDAYGRALADTLALVAPDEEEA